MEEWNLVTGAGLREAYAEGTSGSTRSISLGSRRSWRRWWLYLMICSHEIKYFADVTVTIDLTLKDC